MSRLGSKAAKAKLKQIGGSLFERWSVWINSIIRAKSYQHIKCFMCDLEVHFKKVTNWYCMAVVSSCCRMLHLFTQRT